MWAIFLLSLQTQAVDDYTKSLIKLDSLLTDIENQEKIIERSLQKIKQSPDSRSLTLLRQDLLYQKEDLNQMQKKYRRLRNLFMYKYPQRARRDLRKKEEDSVSSLKNKPTRGLDSLQDRLKEVRKAVFVHWGQGEKKTSQPVEKDSKKKRFPASVKEKPESLLLSK